MKTKIPVPFDPEKFRNEGHKLVDSLANYLYDTLNAEEKIGSGYIVTDRVYSEQVKSL